VYIGFEVYSRSEVSLQIDIFRPLRKFVIGFFSPDYEIVSDVRAYYLENGIKNPLTVKEILGTFNLRKITMIECEFLDEFRDLERLTLNVTLFESIQKSELIDGREQNFPFDEYTLNLYVVYLEQIGGKSELHLWYSKSGPEIGLLDGPENEIKNIENYPEIKAYLSTENAEPVVQLVRLKFGTKDSIMHSIAITFWPFYLVTGIGLWFSLRGYDHRSVIEVLLTSAVLLLALSTYYLQINPPEIPVSAVTAMIKVNAFTLMLSFAFVSLAHSIMQHKRMQEINREQHKRMQEINRELRYLLSFIFLLTPLCLFFIFQSIFHLGMGPIVLLTVILILASVGFAWLALQFIQYDIRGIKRVLQYVACLVLSFPPLVILGFYREIFLKYLLFFISIPAAVMALATSLSYVFTMALGNNKKTEKVKKK